MTLFALYFKYVVDPRWSLVSGLTLLLTASDMDPVCEASLTVCRSYGQSGLPWWTGMVQSQWVSDFMAWDGSESSSITTMLLSVMWTTMDLSCLRFLRVPHCSSVMSFLGGLASWTLVVTALLKFLTLSASAVLTSDETLVSITWLRWHCSSRLHCLS